MISTRLPKWKLPSSIGLGLLFCLNPTSAYCQTEPSPSDGLNENAPLRSDATDGVVQPPSDQANGQAVPAPLPLVAASSDPTSQQLQTIVIEAIGQLDASRLPQSQESISHLQLAITDLENYINLNSPNGQAWSKFLKLEELKNELAAEQPQLDKLVELELNMRQNYLGLEYAPYQAVRRGIGDVVRALRYGSRPERTIEVLDGKLKQLVEDLNQPVSSATSDRALEVGLIANYLHEMNQAPTALAQLQQQYSSPNVQLYASESAINKMLSRPVAEPSPVDECLLGTHIVGQACMLGAFNVDVLPMDSGVSLQLKLNANLTTRSNGYNRGVVIGSTSYSPVSATKQIFITPSGISSMPTNVATHLQTSIHSIDHNLRIVRRIASRKAAEQKPLADAIAEGRMQNRVRNQYDAQVNQQLGTANVRLASLQSGSPPELTRLGIPKPQINYNSTSNAIHANARQAAAFQLAALRPNDLAKPQSADIVAEVHQSALVNALDIVLGDRTIRSVDLDDYAMQIAGKVSEEIKQEAEGEPWSIAFAAYRPVDIQFDDGQITVKLRIVRMTRGEQSLDDSAIVTAVYRPTYSNDGVVLDREGPVDVSFTRASRGLRVVTLRSFLKGKFDMFFKEQIVPQRLDQSSLPAGTPHFVIDSLLVDDGWVQVGLR